MHSSNPTDYRTLIYQLKNLNSTLEGSSFNDDLFGQVDKLIPIIKQHLFEIPNEEFNNELENLGKNISKTIKNAEGEKLAKKIANLTSVQKYYELVCMDKRIRADLKKERENILLGLKDNWWKQIIDKSCHKFGPTVFDEALHGRSKEPGYLNGIKEASSYLQENIAKENSVANYKEIHKKACQHFEKSEDSGVIVSKNEIGQFKRMPNHNASFLLINYEPRLEYLLEFNKIASDPDARENWSQKYFDRMESKYPGFNTDLTNKEVIEKNELELNQIQAHWDERIKTVNAEIAVLSEELGFKKPFSYIFRLDDDKIRINYVPISQEDLDKTVNLMFDLLIKKCPLCKVV